MSKQDTSRLSIGIAGLDSILSGGLLPGRAYLLSGGPGSGKTIVGMHFLTCEQAQGEKTLYITLEEPEARIGENAASIGIDMKGVKILDLSPDAEFFKQTQTYDLFSPAEVERDPIAKKIVDCIESLRPKRVFLDSITQFRYLSSDAFQFRKQVLSFLRFMADQKVTLLVSSESTADTPDDDMRFMSDGIIELRFVDEVRTAAVTKYRGSIFPRGRHSLRLTSHGMEVYPRLEPSAHKRIFTADILPSGLPEFDSMLHGGIERGTVTIISGPSGVGKTTLGLQFMKEAAGRGERSVLYAFEENFEALVNRSEAINLPVRAMLERDTLSIVPVEPLYYSPDELATMVRREVEESEARIIMIDSTSGYSLSFQEENIESHLHALCNYLKNMGVAVILLNETNEVISDRFRATGMGISYLADNLLYMRYMETEGRMRRVIGVLKKRLSDFEKTVRELEITRYGIRVGNRDSLSGLQGVLSGSADATPRNQD